MSAAQTMDPIDVRADTTFTQALRCVQFRLPSARGYRPPGYVLALGTRYGLVGMAASHHLLITAEEDEEPSVLAMIESWPDLVEDHVQWEVTSRLPFPSNSNVARLVGKIAALPIRAYLPLYRRLCPLSRSLELVGDALINENKGMIYEGWSWLHRRCAVKLFRQTLEESSDYAMHFFERRQADLEEVPEIALIGE